MYDKPKNSLVWGGERGLQTPLDPKAQSREKREKEKEPRQRLFDETLKKYSAQPVKK